MKRLVIAVVVLGALRIPPTCLAAEITFIAGGPPQNAQFRGEIEKVGTGWVVLAPQTKYFDAAGKVLDFETFKRVMDNGGRLRVVYSRKDDERIYIASEIYRLPP